MSYEAKFSGSFAVQDREQADTVKDILKRGIMPYYIDMGDFYDSFVIEIDSGGFVKYDETAFLATMAKLSPYISSGSIEYCGEDDALWKHEFLNGKWYEMQGSITYTSPAELFLPLSEEEHTLPEDR